MNETARSSGAIALVGAYERDNFGDLLFLELTRTLLGPRPTIATAPTSADVSTLGVVPGEVVEYWPLLRGGLVPALWVVGGEVGGTSMESALHMAGTATARPLSLNRWASPYLPRPSAFERSTDIPLIVNSVGLAGVGGLKGSRRIEAVAALREADFVSVRDAASSLLLEREGIAHSTAPDLVQAIARLGSERLDATGTPPFAVFQIKEKWIERTGVDTIVSAILGSALADVGRLTLMPAGLAPGHDSWLGYSRIREGLLERAPSLDVDVFPHTDPFGKASLIAGAELFVGTSLHGHIIASAHGVPRVSLLLNKVRAYARTWDDGSPTMVGFDDLAQAARAAQRVGGTTSDLRRASEMADLATANARRAVAALEATAGPGRASERIAGGRRVARDLAGPRTRLADLGSDLRRRLRERRSG